MSKPKTIKKFLTMLFITIFLLTCLKNNFEFKEYNNCLEILSILFISSVMALPFLFYFFITTASEKHKDKDIYLKNSSIAISYASLLMITNIILYLISILGCSFTTTDLFSRIVFSFISTGFFSIFIIFYIMYKNVMNYCKVVKK